MTSRQIKDLIRNKAKKDSIDAQVLLRNYMLERLLERISFSRYKQNFILKGGMLVAAMVGLDARTTIDMDATIKGYPLNKENIIGIFNEILNENVNDDIEITIQNIMEIREEAEYPCFRLSLFAQVERTRIPLQVDVTTGDIITPAEVKYQFGLLLENRSIEILAYPLETVLAEKMETIISRNIFNTRMRDFYDLHILKTLQGKNINNTDLACALRETSLKRNTEKLMKNSKAELEKILEDAEIMRLWNNYQKKFTYASDFTWEEVSLSIKELFNSIF